MHLHRQLRGWLYLYFCLPEARFLQEPTNVMLCGRPYGSEIL
jgi:hypothetical protein